MTTVRTFAAAALLAAVTSAHAAAQNAPVAPLPPRVDSFEEAVRQTRQRTLEQRPRPSSQVAVLNLMLDAEGRELRGARVDRVQVVFANAPKVFARSRGTWEVRLQGRQPVTYRIPNPLEDIEIENPPGSPSPFSQVVPTGPVPFELVVPLTRAGSPLGVERIQVVDTVTGRVVVDTPVRR
jgi:hypothetical protein